MNPERQQALALIGILPIGSNDVGVSALLNAGGVPIAGASLSQQRVSIGDPQLSAVLGWNSGAFSWKTGVMVNVPIGDYDSGRLDNIAFNRWAIDVNGGLTWLDPATGFELSGVAGFTFNGTNDVTNYQTGTEFHLELAAVKHVSPQVQLGMVGYYYNQISGDSGSGALLGAFKGEVAAIGPHFSWTIPFGQLPVTLGTRGFVEFGAANRLEGGAGYVFLSLPLHITGAPPPPN